MVMEGARGAVRGQAALGHLREEHIEGVRATSGQGSRNVPAGGDIQQKKWGYIVHSLQL